MEVIHEAPNEASFVPLATYQSQTPDAFFGGPPILYHYSPRASLSSQSTDLHLAPALAGLFGDIPLKTNGHVELIDEGQAWTESQEVVIQNVDIWVTSE